MMSQVTIRFGKKFLKHFIQADVADFSAQIAYFLLLSLFPFSHESPSLSRFLGSNIYNSCFTNSLPRFFLFCEQIGELFRDEWNPRHSDYINDLVLFIY